MASFSDRTVALARIYGDALFGLAEARGKADEIGEELRELDRALDDIDPRLRGYLASPLVDTESRSELLEDAFRGRLDDLLVDFLQVLNRRRRGDLLAAVAAVYEQTLNRRRGRVEVRVVSAVALDEGQRQKIRAAVRQRLGKEAVLEETVEPSLLGGAVFHIGDEKTDGSVATRLDGLSKALLARASREIHAGTYVEP